MNHSDRVAASVRRDRGDVLPALNHIGQAHALLRDCLPVLDKALVSWGLSHDERVKIVALSARIDQLLSE